MTPADLTPQGTPWRTTAPDPAESRWWWVHRGGPGTVAAEFVGCVLCVGALRLYVGDWPAGWRCAPVLSGEYERGRADGLREAERIAGAESARVTAAAEEMDGGSRASEVADEAVHSAETIGARIRARIAAPRPESAPAPAVDPIVARCETCNGVVPASVEEVAALRRALATVADVVRSEVDGDRCTACTDTLSEDGSGHHASCPLGRIRDALGVRRG